MLLLRSRARREPVADLLPAVSCHPLAMADPVGAKALSSLLRLAVTPGTACTYDSAFSQLTAFCAARGLQSLPVDNVTLAAWLAFKGRQGVKAKSLSKYVSGIRHAHILHLGRWHLSDDVVVSMALRAIGVCSPSSDKLQKVPLSLDTILRCAQVMNGWPVLRALSYDDLLWLTASVIAFFAALRGGEFFVRPGSPRPVLRRSMLSVARKPGARFIRVNVPSPKTGQERCFEPALAMDPGPDFLLAPVSLWNAYEVARVRLFGLQHVDPPAFQLQSGGPLSGVFMLGRAKALCRSAGIHVQNSDGSPLLVGAASWRAGYVLSAKNARVADSTIRANGRWRSLPGPAPYSFESTRSLGDAALSISSSLSRGGPSATFAGGRFLSDNVLHHSS